MVHVPQPVLSGGEPLPKEGVMGRLRSYMEDAVCIPEYLNDGVETW